MPILHLQHPKQQQQLHSNLMLSPDAGDLTCDISKKNLAATDFSLFLGGGLRFKVPFSPYYAMDLMVEGGYNLGFLNTHADYEMNNSTSIANSVDFKAEGTRLNRGPELFLRIGFPEREFIDGAAVSEVVRHRRYPFPFLSSARACEL